MGMRPGCVSLKVPPGRRTQSRQNTQYRTPLDPPEGDIVGEQHLDPQISSGKLMVGYMDGQPTMDSFWTNNKT